MTAIVFCDTETTHLDYDLGRVWEFAGIRRESDGEESRLHFMVTDVDIADADPEALAIGKFYDRHPLYRQSPLMFGREAVPEPRWQDLPEQVAAKAVAWFTRDACLIGANVQYDMHMLRTMLKRQRLIPRWHYRPVDVTGYVAGYLKGRGVDPAGLDLTALPWSGARVAAAIGLVQDPETEHTAMGDTEFVQMIWDKVGEPL